VERKLAQASKSQASFNNALKIAALQQTILLSNSNVNDISLATTKIVCWATNSQIDIDENATAQLLANTPERKTIIKKNLILAIPTFTNSTANCN
jgi:hypothetical protein